MYQDLRNILRRNANALQARAKRGELLIIDDLFSGISAPTDALAIFHLDGRLQDQQRDLETISPGLSFKWTSEGVEQFASSARLKASIAEFEAAFRINRVDHMIVGESTFLYTPSNDAVREVVLDLAKGVDILFNHSLNALNKNQDRIDNLSRALMLEFQEARGQFGLLDLAAFLSRATGVEFGLLYLADSPDTPMTRAITVSTASSPNTLTRLAEFLRLQPRIFDQRPSTPGEMFAAIPLPKTLGAELIVNAGAWGKPLVTGAGLEPHHRLLIMPIARPLGPLPHSDEQAPPAAADLLFAFVTRLNQVLLDELRGCVATFADHRYGARRFNLLASLQDGSSVNGPGQAQASGPLNTDDGGTLLESLRQVLGEVLYTTSAHSVSVRLYNPQKRALVGAAVTTDTTKADAIEGSLPDIPIKANTRTSVVVFTFLNAGERLQHTYLRRISPPISYENKGKLKTVHRTYIPQEYRELGLEAPLMRRSMTRSEICFALMKGQLAFGTFNLEAPYPAAFDHDINYLNLVKSGIERLYRAVDQYIDARWLITSAARSDAVHQLWQYQEAGDLFTAEQDRVLKSIFPARTEHAMIGVHKLSTLRSRVVSWINQRWLDALRVDVLDMVKFDSINERTVAAHFLESAFVILRNLIQNSVRHGEPASDLLIIDDRPWFGVRRTPCLRVYYRSSRSLLQPLRSHLGVSPIAQNGGGRVAYGMYNVGLLCRLLGGTLHVTEHGTDTRLAIDIHLPIAER